MKITGTRSYILVDFDNCRKVKIEGELTLTPAFYASVHSIRNWEPPYSDKKISEDERKSIIEQIKEHNNPEFKIIFDYE